MKIDNNTSLELIKIKKDIYEKRTNKELIDSFFATSIIVFFALIEVNGNKILVLFLGVSYFLYFISGISVIIKLNWIRNHAKQKSLRPFATFLYNLVDDIQLTIWFMCFWVASMNIFEQTSQPPKILGLIMIVICLLALAISSKIIRLKPQRIRDAQQSEFTKIVTIVPSTLGFIVFLYFVFANRIPLDNLDFIIATLGTVIAWALVPTIIWDVYEIIFFNVKALDH